MVLKEYIDKVASKLQWSSTADKLTIRDFVNRAVRELFYKYPNRLIKEDYINCVASYTTGTVAVTNASATVTGTGTVWTSAMVGRKIRIGEEDTNFRFYRIKAVGSGTSITLGNINDYTTEDTYDQATASGQNYMIYEDEYTLPSDFWKPIIITNQYSKMYRYTEWELTNRMSYPERTNAGDPFYYSISPYIDTPYSLTATGQKVSVKSTSASDTAPTVTIHGKQLTTNLIVSEALTLTGTTAVNSTNTYVEVYSAVLSTNCVGSISVHEGSGGTGTTIGTMSPQDLRLDLITRSRKIRIYPVPDKIYPILIKYNRTIPFLNSDSDYLQELDETFDDFIIDRAFIEGLYFDNDIDLADRRLARWKAELYEKWEEDFRLERADMQESFDNNVRGARPEFDPLDRFGGNR